MIKIELNRIKASLAKTRKKNKWLTEQLEEDKSIISHWYSNTKQPYLENIHTIDIRELLNPTKINND
ncbi:hypothetical protein GCM10009118_04940 [Wandonia haliotis]|uniref:Ribosomal protein L29 n=1 Tax=Wandonia haliotis TaxID=574963 RepID=A0ABP3Y1G1_9FLAO